MSDLGIGAIVGLAIVLVVLLIAAPLLVWHFLVFPNVDGFVNDLSFYEQDAESQHFLYWFWFWTIAFSGMALTGTKIKTS